MSESSSTVASPMEDVPTTSSKADKLEKIKVGLSKLESLENELRDAPWNNDASPRAIADFQTSLLQRYKQSKALYIQRRVEQVVLEYIPTYDPNTKAFKHPEGVKFDNDNGGEDDHSSNDKGNQVDLEARHDKALSTLESTVESINSKLHSLRDLYPAVCSRRKELERMVEDLNEGENNGPAIDTYLKGLAEEEGATVTDHTQSPSIGTATDEDMGKEQEKLEELQKKKRHLQERLDLMRKEKLERENQLQVGRTELEELRAEEAELLKSGKDMSYFHKKIEELKEMKGFYDNVRGILEEVGGVKLVQVREDTDNQHLHLNLLMYDEYQVAIELEVFQKNLLKVVTAKWISDPVVKAVSGMKNGDTFSMTMSSLDDLVQIAKTSMGPPHDVRFVVREVCARIRIMQKHVDDLAALRERHGVLTKVDTNDRILCSFNDGIVIVLRLYDHWVRLEQVVGVNGWDQAQTAKIRDTIPTDDETLKPTDIVSIVLQQIEKLKKGGEIHPSTPEFPSRQNSASVGKTDDVEMTDA